MSCLVKLETLYVWISLYTYFTVYFHFTNEISDFRHNSGFLCCSAKRNLIALMLLQEYLFLYRLRDVPYVIVH